MCLHSGNVGYAYFEVRDFYIFSTLSFPEYVRIQYTDQLYALTQYADSSTGEGYLCFHSQLGLQSVNIELFFNNHLVFLLPDAAVTIDTVKMCDVPDETIYAITDIVPHDL